MYAKQEDTSSVKSELMYQPSRSLDSFRSDIGMKGIIEVLTIFWETSSKEKREICVERFTSHSGGAFLSDEVASWLEERIPLIFENEKKEHTPHQYWDRLLASYLFGFNYNNNRAVETRIRALELAIQFCLETMRGIGTKNTPSPVYYSGLYARNLSKMIYGFISKHPELYWAPSVPEFLEASLFCKHDGGVIAERALELICRAEDTSFLPRVMELSRKAGEEKEKKEDFKMKVSEERFAAAKSRGVLSEAVRHLLICKTEEAESDTKVFKAALTKTIGERAGQNPPEMHISLNYGKNGALDSVELKLYPITAQARDLLEKCEVSISALGIEIIGGATRELTEPNCGLKYRNPHYRAKFSFLYDVFSVAYFFFLVRQVRKTARLGISVNPLDQGTHQIGHWVHYIHRDLE